MAYATISKPSLHYNTKLYTGNGSTQSITGLGFQPDLNWIKCRDVSENHNISTLAYTLTAFLFHIQSLSHPIDLQIFFPNQTFPDFFYSSVDDQRTVLSFPLIFLLYFYYILVFS